MAMMFDFLNVILGVTDRPTDRPATRLREAAALEIARNALQRDVPLFVSRVRRRSDGPADRIEWLIGTATVGSGQTVRIDDASGEVLEVAPWGVR
jgi:hypothetical protein